MEQTRIFTALKGVRGRKPVDLAALEQLLVRFSQLVVEQPLDQGDRHQPAARLARAAARARRPGGRCTAPRTGRGDLPRPAIRPYPTQYVAPWTDRRTGPRVMIRPIRPEDEPLLVKFHETLSERSV